MDQNPAIVTGSDYQTILGNRIGVTDDGSPPLRAAIVDMWIEGKHNIVQANQVAFASERGIWLPGQMNTLRQNSIYSNALLGILLVDGGNNNLPAPAISLDASGGSGTTCSHCTVELFLDAGNQGRYYLDSVVADADGAFSFPAHCPLPYPYLTATTTDLQGNTPEFISPHFSEPILVPWDCSLPNPLPVLNTLNPASVNGFDPTTLLSVTGSGFFLGSIVQFNGEALTTLYTDSSHLAAILPLGQITATGITNFTVFNPAPGGGSSNSLALEILSPIVTPMNTPSPSPTATATATQQPTMTPTSTGTNTAAPTPTATPSGTASSTPSPTATPSVTATPSPTNTPTASPTATATRQPKMTPTSTGTNTATPTPTDTPTGTASSTPSPTATPSVTATPSPSPTQGGTLVRIYLPLVLNKNSQESQIGSVYHGI